MFGDVVDSGYVLVVQLGSAFGLFAETAKELRVLTAFRPDRFHRDSTFEDFVFGEKHLTYAAATEFCLNDKTPAAAAVSIDGCLHYGHLPGQKNVRPPSYL
jgi:hypothetical protein